MVKSAQVILISPYGKRGYIDFRNLKDFEKFRIFSKDFDFFTIDLEKFTIVLENFGSCSQKSASKNLRAIVMENSQKCASKNMREFDYEDLATRLSVIGFCGQIRLSLKRGGDIILAGNEELQQKKIKNQISK